MNIIPCQLPGLMILEPKVFGDPRGFFMETWNRRRFQESGLDMDWVQDNISVSRRGNFARAAFPESVAAGQTRFGAAG
jgi:dTDP-4-dehydrorhamnose 3,5-epimerase